MPEDSKKNQHKHDAKEQRKPRQKRQQHAEKSEKHVEKKIETPKITAPPKPVNEEPGPEFYKSLKRETDEILKITEEANAKYKKKEIQSNWTKYEMPIESYEEIEEHENLGADYEKLIQASATTGGHFQFKHEKSWDINTGPSLYDKYFEIDMDNLSTAISCIPFFERNDIDQSLFSQIDITSMNQRSVKYKRKYYSDKTYTTPEIEAQDTVLNSIIDAISKTEREKRASESDDKIIEADDEIHNESTDKEDEINVEATNISNICTKERIKFDNPIELNLNENVKKEDITKLGTLESVKSVNEDIDDIDEILLGNAGTEINAIQDAVKVEANAATITATDTTFKVSEDPPEKTKNSIMESPEDLEKWLDDFLDG